eukprot:m.47075 g.47075  ORF g.47075 m.47075 type:complete len:368 (+) comp5951_c0_seq1:319-1422(+)
MRLAVPDNRASFSSNLAMMMATCVARARPAVRSFSRTPKLNSFLDVQPDLNVSAKQTQKSRRSILWPTLLVAAGGAYYISKELASEESGAFPERTVSLITSLPTRYLSRLWGTVNQLELPVWLRKPILGTYASIFGCNLEEAADSNLEHYSNLQEFFVRKLKDGARPIAADLMVSPADSRVLHFGKVEDDLVEQVKGVTYTVSTMLGETIRPGKGKALFHIVLYLAPGDYHHFHSPADWAATTLRHFPGDLLSVSPLAARKIKGLFALNERVVMTGQWKHGAFAYVAVGAYNVGSIRMLADPDLATNVAQLHAPVTKALGSLPVKKGDFVGGFRLGSTIVLVFEAPESFSFTVTPGQKLKMGQALGH